MLRTAGGTAPLKPRVEARGTSSWGRLFGWRPGSALHLHSKQDVAQTLAGLGWAVSIEAAGEGWRADVLAEKRGRRLAVEVQLASITEDELRTRHRRFRRDGVKALWLVGRRIPPSLAANERVPCLPVRQAEGAHLELEVGAAGRWRSLLDVLTLVDARQLRVVPERPSHPSALVQVIAADRACPSCRQPVVVVDVRAAGPSTMCGRGVLRIPDQLLGGPNWKPRMLVESGALRGLPDIQVQRTRYGGWRSTSCFCKLTADRSARLLDDGGAVNVLRETRLTLPHDLVGERHWCTHRDLGGCGMT